MPLTAAAWENFKIRQGTREPGSFRVGRGGGASVLTGIIPLADIDTILHEGIETAVADNTTGKIHRILPVAHPFFAWHFLRNVDNVQGVSFEEKVAADPDGYLEVPPIPYFSNYTEYEMTATFEPRPYALLDDDTVEGYDLNYFDIDGSPLFKHAFREYFRYVEWIRAPAAEFLTADKGQYKFANDGVAVASVADGPADNSGGGTGQIRVLLPTSVWRIKWYCVPYQYVLSGKSYLDRYIGYVNQQTIFEWLPGQALLQAVNVLDVYSPPFPQFTTYDGYDAVSQDKLCDIELVIQTNNRVAVNPPMTGNPSHVTDGHNTAIYAPNGKAYYIEGARGTADAAGDGKPPYDSVPFDLLFQNPDSP